MPEALYIDPTDKTPLVVLDRINNKMEIIGISIPPDGRIFYQPILKWLDDFSKKPNKNIEFIINLEYFNISSSKMILFILYKLQEMMQNGSNVKLKWFYNCEELLEAGEDYQFISKLEFEYIETSKEYLVQ